MVSAEAACGLFPFWFPSLIRGNGSTLRAGLQDWKQCLNPRFDGDALLEGGSSNLSTAALWPLHWETAKSPCVLLHKEELHTSKQKTSLSFSCLLKGPYPVLVLQTRALLKSEQILCEDKGLKELQKCHCLGSWCVADTAPPARPCLPCSSTPAALKQME